MVQLRDGVSDTVSHLNPFDLVIRTTQEKGRGVYGEWVYQVAPVSARVSNQLSHVFVQLRDPYPLV